MMTNTPPDFSDRMREVKERTIDVDDARFNIRLRFYADQIERRWAVMGWTVFPEVETNSGHDYTPKHSFHYVNTRSNIETAVSAVVMEMHREGRRSQRSSDSGSASYFQAAVSRNREIINEESDS